jgi:hypothetical protein
MSYFDKRRLKAGLVVKKLKEFYDRTPNDKMHITSINTHHYSLSKIYSAQNIYELIIKYLFYNNYRKINIYLYEVLYKINEEKNEVRFTILMTRKDKND